MRQSEFNWPITSALKLAAKMRDFRARTEETAHSEVNPNADDDRATVVSLIDWGKYDDVINQLEHAYIRKTLKSKK